MNILYVNCAVRSSSRTARLCERVLGRLGGSVTEIKPAFMRLPVTDEEFLKKRDSVIAASDHEDALAAPAKQFAEADAVVFCAPYWDLSFPAALKQYLEQINVIGVTFAYNEEGRPVGLCKAKKMFYVTTAGGRIISEEYGFGYVRALCHNFYGINDCMMFKAEMLDIVGQDPEAIMSEALDRIDRWFDEQG